MGLRDFTLADVFRRNARLHRDGLAFVYEGERTGHAEYLARLRRTAGALAGLGLQPGDRLAVVADNSQLFMDAFGAAAALGLIFTPINVRLAAEEVGATLANAEPRVVLVQPSYEPLLAGVRGSLPGAERWLQLGPDGSGDRFEALLADGAELPSEGDAGAPCAMIYTAAVAGRPRGALLSHANLIAAATGVGVNWRLGPDDVHLGLLPLFHVAGLLLTLAANQVGGASVLMPRFDPEAALRHIERERASFFLSFPPILDTILDAAERGRADLSSLRVVTGLESPETAARLEAAAPAARFWSAYGQAELSGLATMSPFRECPGSAGRPSFGNVVAILDEADRPVATGTVGDIAVRGATVFGGYWRDVAGTADTFRNGWHHTGDTGRFDADGYLWYAGRSPAKELIKPGGENVYPAEVEAALREHPAIAEASVIGVPDPTWGEAVKAVCVLAPGETATAEEVIAFVGERIARYKRPRHVVFVRALPRTAAGAVDRAAIKTEHGAP